MIYLLPLLLLIIGYISYDRHKKTCNILWSIIYITLVLIFGLRYKVGGDTYNYMSYFMRAPTLSSWKPVDVSLFEPGFTLFTSIIKTYSDNIYVYQTIISAIITFLLMSFVKRNTTYKYLAMILIYISMYLYYSTEVIRESLAVCLLLTFYPLLNAKKYVLYYILCVFLLTLHSSAIICMLLPLFNGLRFNGKFVLYIICFILAGAFLHFIMDRMADYQVFHKLSRYSEHSYVGYAWSGLRFIYFSLIPMLTLYLCKTTFHLQIKYENVICLQILMGFGLWFVPIVFQRLINYTIIFYLVALADVLGTVFRDRRYRIRLNLKVRSSRTQLANMLLIFTLITHMSYYVHLNFYERYIPYHSVFDPVDEPIREKYIAGQE